MLERLLQLLGALAVLAVLAAVVAVERSGASPAAAAAPPRLLVEGDSLSEGIAPALRHRLPGWTVRVDARSGRHVTTGLARLARLRLERVVIFALGTNDYAAPEAWHAARLRDALRRVGAGRCLVIPTVWGDGAARPAFNRPARALARRYGPRRVQLAPWAEAVRDGRVRLVDGTHPARWDVRARLLADAARRCHG